MSFLSTIGKDVKAVFTWLASPKGQTVIDTAGAVVVAVDPQLAGVVTLAESWITKAVSTEALAVAAAGTENTSTQKAAAVISEMGPIVAQYFPAATAAQLTNANNAIVAFLNAFEAPAKA